METVSDLKDDLDPNAAGDMPGGSEPAMGTPSNFSADTSTDDSDPPSEEWLETDSDADPLLQMDRGDPATDISLMDDKVKISPEFLDGLADRLLRDNFLVLECVDVEIIPLHCATKVLSGVSFRGYRKCTAQAKTLSIEDLWNIRRGPNDRVALLLAGRSHILEEIWSTDDVFRYDVLLNNLREQNTIVIFATNAEWANPPVGRHRLSKHRVKFEKQRDWLLPLISNYYDETTSEQIFGRLEVQQSERRWPSDATELYGAVAPLLQSFQLEKVLEQRGANDATAPGSSQVPTAEALAILHGEQLSLEKTILFLRARFEDLSIHSVCLVAEQGVALGWCKSDETQLSDRRIWALCEHAAAIGFRKRIEDYLSDPIGQIHFVRFARRVLELIERRLIPRQELASVCRVVSEATKMDPDGFGHEPFQNVLRRISPPIQTAGDLPALWNIHFRNLSDMQASDSLSLLSSLIDELALRTPAVARQALQQLFSSETTPPALALLRRVDLTRPELANIFYSQMIRAVASKKPGADARIARRTLSERACRSPRLFAEVVTEVDRGGPLSRSAVYSTILHSLLRHSWSFSPEAPHPLLVAMVRLVSEGDPTAAAVQSFSGFVGWVLLSKSFHALLDLQESGTTAIVADNWLLPQAFRREIDTRPSLSQKIRSAWRRVEPYTNASPSSVLSALLLTEWRIALMGEKLKPESIPLALAGHDMKIWLKNGFTAVVDGLQEVKSVLHDCISGGEKAKAYVLDRIESVRSARNLLYP